MNGFGLLSMSRLFVLDLRSMFDFFDVSVSWFLMVRRLNNWLC
jgi:hypothetical protein